jgi:hypothetical protein
MTPLPRIANTEENGAVAAFLQSSHTSFVTAREIAVGRGLAQL